MNMDKEQVISLLDDIMDDAFRYFTLQRPANTLSIGLVNNHLKKIKEFKEYLNDNLQ